MTGCRHDRNSWILFDGNIEWCWRCGAIRRMAWDDDAGYLAPATKWIKPVGPGKSDPWNGSLGIIREGFENFPF